MFDIIYSKWSFNSYEFQSQMTFLNNEKLLPLSLICILVFFNGFFFQIKIFSQLKFNLINIKNYLKKIFQKLPVYDL